MNNLKYYKTTIAILAVILTLPIHSVFAGQSSARSVAMGGAYIGLAQSVDAARLNPANLGLIDYRQTQVEIVGFGANINNNSFSLSDYNKYTGALLTNDDKDYILSQIPSEGFKITADAEAAAFSAAHGNFALTVTGVGNANVNLSKDIFELVFNGNAYADTIEVTGSYSEAVSYLSTGLSYGRPIYNSGTRQLAVGATVKYIRGFAHEEVIELEGLASTEFTGFSGQGNLVARTATGGSGYGLDIGATLRLNNDYTGGISIKNFFSNISWSSNAEEHRYDFGFDTTNIDNIGDDHVISDDTTIEIGNYSSSLPSVMTIGFAKRSGDIHWAIDWEQGFRRAAGASSKPRIAAGVELVKFSALPVRLGYAVGGDRNAAFSIGSGFHLSAFHLDYAVVTGNSLSAYSTKGINVAISTGLYF